MVCDVIFAAEYERRDIRIWWSIVTRILIDRCNYCAQF